MRRRVGILGLLTAGAGLVALGVYLYGRGLEDADKVASVAGLFLNIVALVCGAGSVWLAWVALRESRAAAVGPPTLDQIAAAIRRDLDDEERARRVHDPYPLELTVRPLTGLGDHPANIGVASAGALGGPLSEIAEQYTGIPSGRLVVLGRAGAGKTVLAIRLVLDLIATRSHGDTPVPVLVSLAGWNPEDESLREWVAARITARLPLPRGRHRADHAHCLSLLADGKLLPVLDGFDELPPPIRPSALRAINFSLGSRDRVVLTSRPDEYAEAVAEGDAVTGASAVILDDLSTDQVVRYLPRTARPAAVDRDSWRPVLDHIAAYPRSPIAQAMSTPLLISLARAIYSDTGADPGVLLDEEIFSSPEVIQGHLLGGFIEAAYSAPDLSGGTGLDPQTAGRAMRWVAAHGYEVHTDSINWWNFQSAVPLAWFRGVFGGLGALVGGALATLRNGSVIGLTGTPLLLFGIAFGTLVGIAFGAPHVQPPMNWTIRWRPWLRRTLASAITMFPGGIVVGMAITMVAVAITPGDPDLGAYLARTVMACAVVSVIVGGVLSALLLSWMPSSATGRRATLVADRRTTLGMAGLVMLGLAAVDMVIHGFSLLDALVFAPGMALGYAGFTAWFRFVLARGYFLLTGRLPWRVMRMLEEAHRRGVLRRVGEAYKFRHGLLRDWLLATASAVEPRRTKTWLEVTEKSRTPWWRSWPWRVFDPPRAWLEVRVGMPEIARTRYARIAMAWYDLGWPGKAVAYLEAALSVPAVDNYRSETIIRHNLALTLFADGRVDCAIGVARSEWALRRRSFGENDPHTLNTLMELTTMLLEIGRFADSRGWTEKLLAEYTRLLGPTHPLAENARLLHLVRNALLGDSDARGGLKQIVDEKSTGNHYAARTLGLIAARTGDLEEADRLLGLALGRGQRKDLDTLEVRALRARVRLLHGGDRAVAEAELRAVLRGLRRRLHPNHPQLITVSAALAAIKTRPPVPVGSG